MAKQLKIAARNGNFRRAGFEFGKEPRVLDLKDLTEAQVKALTNDPQLVVVKVDGPPSFSEEEIAAIKKKAADDAKAEIEAEAKKNKK